MFSETPNCVLHLSESKPLIWVGGPRAGVAASGAPARWAVRPGPSEPAAHEEQDLASLSPGFPAGEMGIMTPLSQGHEQQMLSTL